MTMRRMLILMIAVIGIFGSDAFAIYAPSTGRFMQRDPIGYVDGMNLYEYARTNPIRFTDWLGASAAEPEEQKENASKCRKWASKQKTQGSAWVNNLDDCPCQLDMTDEDNPKVSCDDGGEWNSVEDSGKWKKYHPNATYQVRGKANSDGSGQQCTYDENGKLITGGPSAGTPDLHSPTYSIPGVGWNTVKTIFTRVLPGNQGRNNNGHFASNSVGRHVRDDVDPYNACAKAGMLDLYFKYRPPNQGKKPGGGSCDSNEVDDNDSFTGI